MAGKPKTDIDSYFNQTKPHIKTLIENQPKEMGSAKIFKTLWVIWKNCIKLLIDLDLQDLEDAQDTGANAGDKERSVPPTEQGVGLGVDPQEIDEAVNNKLNEWYGWLVDLCQSQLKMLQARPF